MPDIDEIVQHFRDYLIEQEKATNTVENYCFGIRQFFESYKTLTIENGVAWKNDLLESGKKPATVNLRLCALNAYAKMIGSPVTVKRVKVQKCTAIENVISVKDYDRLMSGLLDDGNLKWYWSIRLLASTGARVSEVVRLRKRHLDCGYAELWTKGKIRRIYIPEKFRSESKNFYKDFATDDFLIQSRCGGQITTRGISAMLQNLARRYEIPPEVMHPHSFRHRFAINFLQNNNNLSLLADVMGHESVATTSIYTRLTRAEQIVAVNNTVTW